jgi:hypothetical protein
MPRVPSFQHAWLRKATNNARALRAIMKRWFTGQANKKTLQLLGLSQQQERHFFYTGRRLRREHVLAIAETEHHRRQEIDRAADRIIERTKRKVEFWRQRRHGEITKLAFDLRSLAAKIDNQTSNELEFLLTETRKKLIADNREKAILKKMDIPLPAKYNPLWPGPTPDVSSEMLEAFPLYDKKEKTP